MVQYTFGSLFPSKVKVMILIFAYSLPIEEKVF
ncbi:hypothetical protein BROSI_C0014 [Candidatus Brocadia sinica JPN1]|uniref:Uncharacterized protein n=1 Tax=Candidatus Brocadia sinica JPN1 TaxID=1197129 RepID=A0ABQ0K402_9BACT|nr:hypothetical protein BROSI_C0014 [Candidatus Brocadia sinica JPN1]